MRSPVTLAALVAVFAFATAARAQQPPASQHGTVSQSVNTTTITLEYDRPVLRGRSIFGELLDYDVIWTPGANRATWIDFSAPVKIQGQELPAGRYGLWTIPQERDPWQIIFVSEWDAHHSYFSRDTEVMRVEAHAARGAHMEVLAFYFPVVGPYETTLRFHWGEVVVPLQIEVGR